MSIDPQAFMGIIIIAVAVIATAAMSVAVDIGDIKRLLQRKLK